MAFKLLAQLCVLYFLILILISRVDSAKKCSRTFSRIPVHKDFKLKKVSNFDFISQRS